LAYTISLKLHAKDASFGKSSGTLRDWLARKSYTMGDTHVAVDQQEKVPPRWQSKETLLTGAAARKYR
jgi:hypothetical protein